MKIEIITDRKPFANGKPQEMGSIIDMPENDAKVLIANGFAMAIEEPKKKASKKVN